MNSNIDQPGPIDAESAVIGAVLLDNAALDSISPMLEARDFSRTAHELIWTAIVQMHQRNQPIDVVTLCDLLLRYDRIHDVGGPAYITSLAGSTPTAANIAFYAEIVRRNATRKRAVLAAQKIMNLASKDDLENEEDFFSEIERAALGIRPGTFSNMRHVKDVRKDYFAYLQQKDDFILSGFERFDEWMGGYGRGWLCITAGRPSVGKTAITMQRIRNIASQRVGEVVMFSQEMTRNQLLTRMISPVTRIPAGRFRQKKLGADEFMRIEEAYDQLEKLPIHIEDAKNVTIEEVRSTARQIKRKYKRLAAIVVDYLTIMRIPQSKGMTRAQAIGEVTRTAKQTALELECPFILLAQMSREGAKAEEPQLHHLKESGDIEQDADIVEFLWHNPDDDDKKAGHKVITSTIAKGRDVGVNHFKYKFYGYIQRFEEAGPRDERRI